MERETLQGPYVYEAKLFRSLRLGKDWTQLDLAEFLKVKPQYIAAIEAAVRPISASRAIEIANLFGVDISHIVDAALGDYKIKYLAKVYKEKK